MEIFISIECHGKEFSFQNMCRLSKLGSASTTHGVTCVGAALLAYLQKPVISIGSVIFSIVPHRH